jgi:16S rRNA (cytosine967-C5)-methyltransferase
VISRANREQPADAMLREALHSRRVPSSEETREISRAVFAYYRWFSWLEHQRSLPGQIKYALELAQAFAERPESFSNEKLVERSLPGWVRKEIEISSAWVRAIQAEPKLWLRARRGQGRCSRINRNNVEIPAGGCGAISGKEDLFCRPEFHAGEFEIQDISSLTVGWLCDPAGRDVVDTCAGEGGKTLHPVRLDGEQGLIWASDRAAWRLQS